MCVCVSGPPFPPKEVQVQCGPTAGIMQVRWKPPDLSAAGTSNGASVIGYAVCTKGQKVSTSKKKQQVVTCHPTMHFCGSQASC